MSINHNEFKLLKLRRVREAAQRLGVSVRTLYRIVADGHLRIVHVRGCACICESELDDYLRKLTGGKRS